MKKLTLHKTQLNCAILAANASNFTKGFRIRDIKFLYSLFTNWTDELGQKPLQATQISRVLDFMTKESLASRKISKGTPNWFLSRTGVIELVRIIVNGENNNYGNDFFFTYYFINSYKDKLLMMAKESSSLFPPSLQLELEYLLDVDKYKAREQQKVERRIEKIKLRKDSTKKTAEATKKLLTKGFKNDEVVKYIQKNHPYDLNSEKPLSELLSEIPEDLKVWELLEGNINRSRFIYSQQIKMLENYLRQIVSLQ